MLPLNRAARNPRLLCQYRTKRFAIPLEYEKLRGTMEHVGSGGAGLEDEEIRGIVDNADLTITDNYRRRTGDGFSREFGQQM